MPRAQCTDAYSKNDGFDDMFFRAKKDIIRLRDRYRNEIKIVSIN